MKFFLIAILISCSTQLISQDPTPPSEIDGLELRQWLKDNWHTPWHDDLGYSQARIEMFGSIDAENGLIECVYTGFTQASGDVTFPDPINTEHTVPQSFFDSSAPMKSDLHHIFPSHGNANSIRGNLSFDEVTDSQTDTWITSTSGAYASQTNIPSSGIDNYSEVLNTIAFEPREEKKGNTARAIFYFYTMYPDELLAQFSDINAAGDLDVLYDWHIMDPPDALEIERDEEIQAVQGNYNPYIRMPELAAPAWGFISSVDELQLDIDVIVDRQMGTITVSNEILNLELRLMNSMGQVIRSTKGDRSISIQDQPSGIYILHATSPEGRFGIKKLFIQ